MKTIKTMLLGVIGVVCAPLVLLYLVGQDVEKFLRTKKL